jgi:hypothetical protein
MKLRSHRFWIAGGATTLFALLLIGLGANAYSNRLALVVDVVAMSDPEHIGFVTRMAVRIVNKGNDDVAPIFTVISSVPFPVRWQSVAGPSQLMPGSAALYQIDSPDETAIPVGDDVVVRVNDIHRHLFVASQPLKAVLPESPVIVNQRFDRWTGDPVTSEAEPLGWTVMGLARSRIGPTLRIARATVAGRQALAFRIGDESPSRAWQGIGVQQDINDPARVARLFAGGFTISVYPTFSYTAHDLPGSAGTPGDIIGIQIYADARLLWIMFSDADIGRRVQSSGAVVVLHAPLNRWSSHHIDLSAIYRSLGWQQPQEMTLSLIAGTSREAMSMSQPAFGEITLGSAPPRVPGASNSVDHTTK